MKSRHATDSALEEALRNRFQIREETIDFGSLSMRLILPQSAEDLLDEDAFARDECMPYWADLWPSAKGLARWILAQPRVEGRWLELGCGLGLPSLAVLARGGEVTASDHNEDALQFARANAQRNKLDELNVTLLDWRERNLQCDKFDTVMAADVLYEQRNALALRDLLPRVVAHAGRFVLADPGRRFLQQFQSLMRERGWRDVHIDTRVETQNTSRGETRSTIRIIEFKKV